MANLATKLGLELGEVAVPNLRRTTGAMARPGHAIRSSPLDDSLPNRRCAGQLLVIRRSTDRGG